MSLASEHPLNDRAETLLTINSHLINFVDLEAFQSQLRDLELRLSNHGGPLIFAGDFNVWSGARSTLLDQVATRLGLLPATFTTNDHKKIKRFLCSPPLDYIFYKGLEEKTLQARVLDYITSSDHKPMLVEFAAVRRPNSET